jgi:hypothetical protein
VRIGEAFVYWRSVAEKSVCQLAKIARRVFVSQQRSRESFVKWAQENNTPGEATGIEAVNKGPKGIKDEHPLSSLPYKNVGSLCRVVGRDSRV